MPKVKSVYVCQNCGTKSPKWVGKCNACGEWNTFEEEIESSSGKSPALITRSQSNTKPQKFSQISTLEEERVPSGNNEVDRVLGGGVVKGGVTLLGGEPGIGKSTLLLQVSLGINRKVLYVSGEESASQIKLRADRLGLNSDSCYFLSEIVVEQIINQAIKLEPELIVVDSIQTLRTDLLDSSPGTVSQIRECAMQLLKYAKENSIPVFLVGHITKEGSLAGPKVLEHIVDTVLQFEGDNNFNYRILRGIKNRFGSTAEIGIFEMLQSGLREVENPSEMLISNARENYSGKAICASIEGMRTFLIEVQSLVSSAVYGTPQRSATGAEIRRLNMLLAVLEKRAGFRLSSKDVFLNIAGGIKVTDTAMDLPIICAVLSSDLDRPIAAGTCFAGEVGLSGEIRPVGKIDLRIAEAAKLGFKRIYVPKQNQPYSKSKTIEVIEVEKIEQVFQTVFLPHQN